MCLEIKILFDCCKQLLSPVVLQQPGLKVILRLGADSCCGSSEDDSCCFQKNNQISALLYISVVQALHLLLVLLQQVPIFLGDLTKT